LRIATLVSDRAADRLVNSASLRAEAADQRRASCTERVKMRGRKNVGEGTLRAGAAGMDGCT
jgi:hypothetical protein